MMPTEHLYLEKLYSPECEAVNSSLLSGFNKYRNNPDIKRTHLFNGRYENIYLDATHIPELNTIEEVACKLARKITGHDNTQTGYWFNDMPPGAVTTLHRHDDYDEILSAVYYVSVPDNSGNLVLHQNNKKEIITPKEGMFVFFSPDMPHEVTENLSDEHRLSIGMNFGPGKS